MFLKITLFSVLALSAIIIVSCGSSSSTAPISQALDSSLANYPVLSDLSMPDSLNRYSLDTTYLFISADNTYDIGVIDTVYFTVTRPDGTSNGFHFPMLDTGLLGDSVAYDGRYARGIIINAQNNPGIYRFDFYARNTLAILSQPISRELTVY